MSHYLSLISSDVLYLRVFRFLDIYELVRFVCVDDEMFEMILKHTVNTKRYFTMKYNEPFFVRQGSEGKFLISSFFRHLMFKESRRGMFLSDEIIYRLIKDGHVVPKVVIPLPPNFFSHLLSRGYTKTLSFFVNKAFTESNRYGYGSGFRKPVVGRKYIRGMLTDYPLFTEFVIQHWLNRRWKASVKGIYSTLKFLETVFPNYSPNFFISQRCCKKIVNTLFKIQLFRPEDPEIWKKTIFLLSSLFIKPQTNRNRGAPRKTNKRTHMKFFEIFCKFKKDRNRRPGFIHDDDDLFMDGLKALAINNCFTTSQYETIFKTILRQDDRSKLFLSNQSCEHLVRFFISEVKKTELFDVRKILLECSIYVKNLSISKLVLEHCFIDPSLEDQFYTEIITSSWFLNDEPKRRADLLMLIISKKGDKLFFSPTNLIFPQKEEGEEGETQFSYDLFFSDIRSTKYIFENKLIGSEKSSSFEFCKRLIKNILKYEEGNMKINNYDHNTEVFSYVIRNLPIFGENEEIQRWITHHILYDHNNNNEEKGSLRRLVVQDREEKEANVRVSEEEYVFIFSHLSVLVSFEQYRLLDEFYGIFIDILFKVNSTYYLGQKIKFKKMLLEEVLMRSSRKDVESFRRRCMEHTKNILGVLFLNSVLLVQEQFDKSHDEDVNNIMDLYNVSLRLVQHPRTKKMKSSSCSIRNTKHREIFRELGEILVNTKRCDLQNPEISRSIIEEIMKLVIEHHQVKKKIADGKDSHFLNESEKGYYSSYTLSSIFDFLKRRLRFILECFEAQGIDLCSVLSREKVLEMIDLCFIRYYPMLLKRVYLNIYRQFQEDENRMEYYADLMCRKILNETNERVGKKRYSVFGSGEYNSFYIRSRKAAYLITLLFVDTNEIPLVFTHALNDTRFIIPDRYRDRVGTVISEGFSASRTFFERGHEIMKSLYERPEMQLEGFKVKKK